MKRKKNIYLDLLGAIIPPGVMGVGHATIPGYGTAADPKINGDFHKIHTRITPRLGILLNAIHYIDISGTDICFN